MLHFSRWKTILIWLIVLGSFFIALPNLLSDRQLASLPSWVPSKRVALGLDLQGGSHILLKIERDDIVKDRLEATVDDISAKLRDAGIAYTGLSGVGQTINVKITDPKQFDAAKTSLQALTETVAAGDAAVRELTMAAGGDGQMTFALTDEGIDYRKSVALTRSTEVLRRRIMEISDAEPLIGQRGRDRILVQVPGIADPEHLKSLLSQTAKLTFRIVDDRMAAQDAISGQPPAASEILYSMDDPPEAYLVRKEAFASGENLIDVKTIDATDGQAPSVAFRFDPAAAERFANVTRVNVGKTLAIVLDSQVLSTFVIREPITGDSGQIAADFSDEGAGDLAIMLRSGPLPATLTVLEERTIGSSLGADSINSGVTASIIGAALVVGFMLLAYGFLGAIASFAVATNVVMIIGILSLFGLPLTLPGIAGIVLTIGMAVDANVLIYERIREEFRNGRPFGQSIGAGFSRAFSTILDANLTTLIAAVVLLYLGSGAVRGFAATVAIGIVTTLFTAFTLTFWIAVAWSNRSHPTALPKGVRTGIFDSANIRFMSLRRYTFAISAALAIASMIGFAGLGMNLGIDFSGGSTIEIQAREGEADIADIRERLGELNLGDIDVQSRGDTGGAIIRVQTQEGGENAEQSAVVLIRGELEDAYEFRRVEVVGPSVSGELTKKATLGVVAALAAILVYIWFRFQWQFALGAIIATLHDVILTIGLFVFTGLEFNLSSVAAVLTIVGYSLNDTVVVYDRVRENLKRYKKMPLPLLIDASINQTLSRTVLTSLATMLALAALCVFGGEMIRSFAFVMLFGVAVGTFSSIYMAAPMLIAFKLRPETIAGDDGANGETTIGKAAV